MAWLATPALLHRRCSGPRWRSVPIRTFALREVAFGTVSRWSRDGLVSATTTPMLLRLVAQGKLTPEKFVSHRFTFEAIIDAYDTFGRAAETKALKVAITR
jgi:threonine dehydrogenase-like Zn-dependent dehydrogenase